MTDNSPKKSTFKFTDEKKQQMRDRLNKARNKKKQMKKRSEEVSDAFRWLSYEHLPEHLQPFSKPFHDCAVQMLDCVHDDSPELVCALNKLIEAKDSMVRAGIKNLE